MRFLFDFFNVTATNGWTGVKMNANGVVASNIVDRNTGSPTTYRLTHTGTNWSPGSSTGLVLDIDYHGIPANVYRNWNNTPIANSSTLTLDDPTSTMPIGEQWVIGFIAAAASSPVARNTTLTANGVSATYNNTPSSAPIYPNPPVYLTTTTVDDGTGKGKIDFTFAGDNTQKYATAIIATNEPTIFNVNSDDSVKIGQAITWNAALITPTSATIDGIPLTNVTATGGTIPNYVDGGQIPNYGGVQLVLSDGVKTATRTVYVQPADTWQYTRIRDVSNTNDGFLKKYLPSLAVDDSVTYKLPSALVPAVALNTIDFDGATRTDHIGIQQIHVRSMSSKVMVTHNLITEAESPPEPGNTTSLKRSLKSSLKQALKSPL